MKKSRLMALITLTGVVVILAWWLSPSQIIKRQTKTVVQCLDIPQTATKTYRALKTNSFSNLLERSVTCQVNIANYQRQFSRDQLIESHQLFAFHVDSSVAKIDSIDVEIIDDDHATANTVIDFAVSSKKTSLATEKIELNLSWSKSEAGKWKLTKVKMQGALNAPL